ncbi:MAG: exo-alpha-sialidase [Verrucomicrobiota bacterium]
MLKHLICLTWMVAVAQAQPPDYRIQLDVLSSGFDRQTCWVHPRAGAIPGRAPIVVLTMQKLLLTGSDVFYELNEMRTDDLGKKWTGPAPHGQTLGRRDEPQGVIVNVCDFTPKWHAKSGLLLGTGHTVRYQNDKVMANRPRETAYSIYDPKARTWTPWTTVEMPAGEKFRNAGAGSVQRFDLPDGDVLLPIYFQYPGKKTYSTTVLRCAFDGRKLAYREHGTAMSVEIDRGLYEPSITKFRDRYYLTLRNDRAGYVTSGKDGLHFDEPRKWTWDDGTDLGNYNTQQHWVTHSDGLFLVYTRRGANNDHVFRNRAPLFIAQVDPESLRVIRSTERILVPEKGARLGNFAVTEVNERETWVTVAEWMQPVGCEKYGSDNRVFAARILWQKPNRAWNQR